MTAVDQHPPDEASDVQLTALAGLRTGLTPRVTPVNEAHVRVLTEVLDHLPPILVHRPTMTVIDGVHRLTAHRRAGRDVISCRMLDGDLTEAFVVGVAANIAHGLPLTIGERRRAAAVVLDEFPDRSDRWIARACGLSHTTVAVIRRELIAAGARVVATSRIGIDGRTRRVDIRALRDRIEHPEPRPSRVAPSAVHALLDRRPRSAIPTADPDGDVALRSVEELAQFADWLSDTRIDDSKWAPFTTSIPLSRLYELSDDCRRRARSWSAFADALDGRARASRGGRHPHVDLEARERRLGDD